MDVNTITALIGSVGFPIFACLALGYYIVKVSDELRKTIEENTRVINTLILKLTISDVKTEN